MKDKLFFSEMLVISLALCLVFISCDNGNDEGDEDAGSFVINGIPNDYNGKYAVFYAYGEPVENEDGSTTSYTFAVGCKNFNFNTWLPTGVQISGGSVNLSMVTYNSKNQSIGYTGSGISHNGMLLILKQQTVQNEEDLWWSYSGGDNDITDYELGDAIFAFRVFPNIAFTNGNASKAWSNGFGHGNTSQNHIRQSFISSYRNSYMIVE